MDGWARAKGKKTVLASALRYFGERGGGALDRFVELLADLPQDAGSGLKDAPRLAADMGRQLQDKMANDPLLNQGGPRLDPELLLGLNSDSGRTTISVLNMMGLTNTEAQRQLVSQLAMTLFTWIRKRSSPDAKGPIGLLVIDEVRSFLPAAKADTCKENILRLAALGSKYGLGLVLATQNPKNMDAKAIDRFSTWFLGLSNSPHSIKQIKRSLIERGGSGKELAKLDPGQFFVSSVDHIVEPVKIAVPMCLSHHPHQPLTESEILEKAAASDADRHPASVG